jgi:hypothetical protein
MAKALAHAGLVGVGAGEDEDAIAVPGAAHAVLAIANSRAARLAFLTDPPRKRRSLSHIE